MKLRKFQLCLKLSIIIGEEKYTEPIYISFFIVNLTITFFLRLIRDAWVKSQTFCYSKLKPKFLNKEYLTK